MLMGTRNIAAIVSLVAVAACLLLPNTHPANATTTGQTGDSRSVWDGIYTQKQAERGQALYDHECSSCHGDKLTGKVSENAPPLTGAAFEKVWTGRTVGDLFKKILRKMPGDDPGTLTEQETADLVAFILSFNKFPAGKTELPPDYIPLSTIRIEARKP
jgi:cytochrome c